MGIQQAMFRWAVLACVLGVAQGRGAISAGDSNFDTKVLGSGKNAFVKFLAPW